MRRFRCATILGMAARSRIARRSLALGIPALLFAFSLALAASAVLITLAAIYGEPVREAAS